MTTYARRLTAAVAALVALVAVLAPATAGASSASTVRLEGEATTLRTDPATTKALISNGILPLPVGPATVTPHWTSHGLSLRYGFPITGGRVDAASLVGHINHSGGLEFVNLANGHTLTLTNFRIQISAHPGLTAAVNGNPRARVRILNLDLSHATIVKDPPTVKVAGVKATLTSTAASALNSSLGVHLFSAGITLGTANVDARIA
ncbi:MAG: HtaA domain-containing protein [Gaiellales bacterium]